jgi:hypothetical protein
VPSFYLDLATFGNLSLRHRRVSGDLGSQWNFDPWGLV